MMYTVRVFTCAIVVSWTILALAQQQNEISQGFNDCTDASSKAIKSDIDATSYSIFTLDNAKDLLSNTVCAGKKGCDPENKDFYAIIHVLKWTDAKDNKQSVVGEHWYVYHPEKYGWTQDHFTDAKRMFNAKGFYLLYVNLNLSTTYTPLYQIQITNKLPQNVANVVALLQLEVPAAGKKPAACVSGWGGREVVVGLRPSDIKIDPRSVPDPNSPGTSSELTSAQVFNNEGKYWWDVSVAVPVKKISEVKFDSTNNTVTPKQTATQNMFGIVDVYFKPVDLSQKSYSLIPHPIAGVSLAQQPLHKVLVGGAIGFYFAELYAGVLFVKEQNLSGLEVGSSATSQQLFAATHYSYSHQFSVGINLPVRSIVNSTKKQ